MTNTGAALVADDAFQLFVAAPASGSFSSLALPPLAPGLCWNVSQLAASGTIRVAPMVSPQITPRLQADGTLALEFPSEAGLNSILQSAAALTLPARWSNLSTNAGTRGALWLTVPVDPAAPGQFFRVLVY